MGDRSMSQDNRQFNGNNGPQMGPDRRHDGPQNHPQQGPQGGRFQGYQSSPPRGPIPVNPRRGPTFEIQDVRKDLMSESDMKEDLSDYVIIRFEKVNDKDGIDEHGRPKWPGWEQAIKTEDWSIPKEEAFRKIQQLNLKTRSVLDKKNSLTPPLKRQIDKTLEDLTRRESEFSNHYWTLVQIDHQLRAIEPYFPSSLSYQPARKHRSTNHRISSKRPYSKGHSKKKRAYERLSLTAYFKRVPRPGVNIKRLWEEHRKTLQGGIRAPPGEIHGTFPPTQPNNTFPIHQQQPRPPPTHPPNHIPQGPLPQGPHPQGQYPQGHRPPGPLPTNPKMPVGNNDSSDSESGSRSSRRSTTPPSSVSDRRGGGPRKDYHHHDHVHVEVNPPPIHPLGQGLPRVNESPRPRPLNRTPVPPYPVSHEGGSVASHMERIREDAYERGRRDARLARDLPFSNVRGRPRPHIIQEHSPPRRVYRTRSDDEDEITRRVSHLSVYDRDAEDDVAYRREVARRRHEIEHRAQRGSILEDDPFATSSLSSSYTYSTDGRGHGRIEIHPEPHLSNPRVRRVVSYF
ncbi:hypothetical protein FHL15_004365 [Xylaria flabelliformis]|uniref:Uncharacterized protein n=1 Tax=Xylaria flabelliformis TaxID=2512241 RepID=A0A553I3Y0_9PEZI|nr:hypothetical protein FHL15_004365 [Xylaria flabelliformis]